MAREYVIHPTIPARLKELENYLAQDISVECLALFAMSVVRTHYCQSAAAWADSIMTSSGNQESLAERNYLKAADTLKKQWPKFNENRLNIVVTAYRKTGLIDELINSLAGMGTEAPFNEDSCPDMKKIVSGGA